MTEFIEFCKEYGFYLVSVFCFVVEIIFIIIKRKPKSIDQFVCAIQEVCNVIPAYCSKVERAGSGNEKKLEVLSRCLTLFEKKIGRRTTENERERVLSSFSSMIEAVLSAPTKKEIN